MCKLSDLFKKKQEPEKPDWVTQSREKVAEEEIYAASIQYTYQGLIKWKLN